MSITLTTQQQTDVNFLVTSGSAFISQSLPVGSTVSSDEIIAAATQQATFYVLYILPNLRDSLGNPITFIVPGGS